MHIAFHFVKGSWILDHHYWSINWINFVGETFADASKPLKCSWTRKCVVRNLS